MKEIGDLPQVVTYREQENEFAAAVLVREKKTGRERVRGLGEGEKGGKGKKRRSQLI